MSTLRASVCKRLGLSATATQADVHRAALRKIIGLGGSAGTITDKMEIMKAAVSGGAPTYLYDEDTLRRWERAGLVEATMRMDDWVKYKATEAGREAFARGRLP